MKNKIILIILVIIIIPITSLIIVHKTKYKTSILFKTDNYKYEITYPIKQPNEWSLTYGSTDETEYPLKNGEILKTIATIRKLAPKKNVVKYGNIIMGKAIGGTIEIFILAKSGQAYKEVLKSGETVEILLANFSNAKNNKVSLPLKKFYNWLDNDRDNNKLLKVIFDIEKDKVILFFFYGSSYSINYDYYGDTGYDKEDKKLIIKEFHKIINSLRRYEIDGMQK
jgi:hypothetical protein